MLRSLQSRSRVLSLVLALTVLGASVPACHPIPGPDGGPASTPTSWVDGARLANETLGWALPAARVILSALLSEPERTIVLRLLDGVADYNARFGQVLSVYAARGGDACAVFAASGAVRESLVQLGQVLADRGVALGTTLERVADSLGGLSDTLTSQFARCDPDAGLRSTGDEVNQRLRASYAAARARGLVLRHDLDDLRPLPVEAR